MMEDADSLPLFKTTLYCVISISTDSLVDWFPRTQVRRAGNFDIDIEDD